MMSPMDEEQSVPKTKVLLVEDDEDERDLVAQLIETPSLDVIQAHDFDSAISVLTGQAVDAVLTDLNLNGNRSGLDLCSEIQRIAPGIPVIVVTGHGNLDTAIGAIRGGAYDFLTKPVDAQLLSVSLSRALEHRRVLSELKRLKDSHPAKGQGRLLGNCPPMQQVYDLIERVAPTPASVLISGESGTGKELVARALHEESGRTGRFLAINCGAVPANLLEAELFGHERGAFTGAAKARKGLLLDADGGTLFLDEIGEMPEEMQVKLLRVLQERKVRPVGGSEEISFDVRIIAATHRDLEDDIETGRFREDLFYRLNVVQIHLPPLRLRGNDILLLANRFIEDTAARMGRPVEALSAEAAKILLSFDWPGNVRQLQNCIERAVTLTRFSQITPDDLPPKITGYVPEAPSDGLEVDPEHVQPLDVVERVYIEKVLKIAAGNKSLAARLLGVDRRTLYRKLDAYEDDADEKA